LAALRTGAAAGTMPAGLKMISEERASVIPPF
jgi:hypothetical protein